MSARILRSASASVTRRSSVSFSSRSASAFGQHLLRRLRDGAEHSGDLAALVADRRIGEREPGLLVVSLAVHDERQVLAIGGLPGHRRVDQRADVGPDLRPDVVEAPPERARMLGAEDLGVGVVVEEAELVPQATNIRSPAAAEISRDSLGADPRSTRAAPSRSSPVNMRRSARMARRPRRARLFDRVVAPRARARILRRAGPEGAVDAAPVSTECRRHAQHQKPPKAGS